MRMRTRVYKLVHTEMEFLHVSHRRTVQVSVPRMYRFFSYRNRVSPRVDSRTIVHPSAPRIYKLVPSKANVVYPRLTGN